MMETVQEPKKAMVKGVKISRAAPGDILDVYGLMKQAQKEQVFQNWAPTEAQFKQLYWDTLDELAVPEVFYLIARRGRAVVGMVKFHVLFSKVAPSPICGMSMVYVVPKKRRLGIGRELVKTGISFLKKTGIPRFEFHCSDELVGYYQKICGAKKTLNLMVVD